MFRAFKIVSAHMQSGLPCIIFIIIRVNGTHCTCVSVQIYKLTSHLGRTFFFINEKFACTENFKFQISDARLSKVRNSGSHCQETTVHFKLHKSNMIAT